MDINKHLLTLLTNRERQIISLVAEGLSNKAVAKRLSIEESTAKMHIHNMLQKLNVTNRVMLAAIVINTR